MEEILQNIKEARNVKGFSYEYMANVLQISTSAYRKIESSETKLTVERLFQIAEILQIPISKLLGSKLSNVFYQNNNNDIGTIIGYQDVENYFHHEKHETTQKLIQIMERELEHLRKEVVFLREITKK